MDRDGGPQDCQRLFQLLPLGILFVGKYPLDLVAVFEDGTIELVQFDGHYCHGDYRNNADPANLWKNVCANKCHALPRYAEGRTRRECEEKTVARDEFILNWMIQIESHLMTYSVYSDCCSPEYHPVVLRQAFDTIPRLAFLVRGLDSVQGTLDYLVNRNEEADRETTFFALVEGYCRKNDEHNFEPVFLNSDDQQRPPTSSSGQMLLTADYYRYLVQEFDFAITSLHWVSYYKRCEDLPRVFESLVFARQSLPKGSAVASLLKSIINYSCGYFGLHRSKAPFSRTRITYRLPQNYNRSIHEVSPLPYFNGHDLYVIRTLSPTSHLKYKSTTPLLHFFGIIEMGKLQINWALQVLQRHLRPSAFRLLYSNVDNLILACSSNTFEEALADPSYEGRLAFLRDWAPLLGTEPGTFKQEWYLPSGHGWKFVTPFRMFYAVTTGTMFFSPQD